MQTAEPSNETGYTILLKVVLIFLIAPLVAVFLVRWLIGV